MDNNPDAIFKYNPIRTSQSLSRETIAVGSDFINSYERITCEDFFIIDFVRQDIVHVSSGLRRFLHGWGIMADEGNHNLFNEYEIIDSITQEDVKKHLKRYLMEQEPIVHVKKETQTGDENENSTNK